MAKSESTPWDSKVAEHKSGLCTGTERDTGYPEGARISELIWSRSGTPSGAVAWDLPDPA